MTRLKTIDIEHITGQLEQYEKDLFRKTGRGLRGIACHALGLNEKELKYVKKDTAVAVIPVKSGKGIISGFTETVKNILAYIGFNTFITGSVNVAGIAEAAEKGAGVFMMADDIRFIALCVKTGRIVDNSEATAKGFISGLDLMAGGINDRRLLVLGCGPVGRNAAIAAAGRGAKISIYDPEVRLSRSLAEDIKKLTGTTVNVEKISNKKSGRYLNVDLIVEATNNSHVITESDIRSGTFIAAPGMPLGLTQMAVNKVSGQLLHDPLQLGVCVMAIDAVEGGIFER